MANTPNSDNLLLGSGALYLDLFANGAKTGERHLGNVSSFSLTTTDETREKYESMTKTRGLYKSVTVKRDIVLAITGDEFSQENVALNVMGKTAKLTQAAGTATDETVTSSAIVGRYYALAHRNVADVEVSVALTAMTEGTDFTVDARTGRIYVIPGGAIKDSDEITADYTYETASLSVVEGGTESLIEGFVRFVGDPAAGPAVEVQVFKVQITPNGELGFISDDFGNWTLSCKVLADQSQPTGNSPYYRVIYL